MHLLVAQSLAGDMSPPSSISWMNLFLQLKVIRVHLEFCSQSHDNLGVSSSTERERKRERERERERERQTDRDRETETETIWKINYNRDFVCLYS